LISWYRAHQLIYLLVSYLDDFGDAVNILGLDSSLELVLEKAGEVLVELGSLEVVQDVLPAGWIVGGVAQVRFDLP